MLPSAAGVASKRRPAWLRTFSQPLWKNPQATTVSGHAPQIDAVILQIGGMVRSVLCVVQGHDAAPVGRDGSGS